MRLKDEANNADKDTNQNQGKQKKNTEYYFIYFLALFYVTLRFTNIKGQMVMMNFRAIVPKRSIALLVA